MADRDLCLTRSKGPSGVLRGHQPQRCHVVGPEGVISPRRHDPHQRVRILPWNPVK